MRLSPRSRWFVFVGTALLAPAFGIAQTAAFQCRQKLDPLSPVVTAVDVGTVRVGTVGLAPLGGGLACRNVQSVPVQFSLITNDVPPTPTAGGFYVWAFCFPPPIGCIDGSGPRLVQPNEDIVFPIALYSLRPGAFAGSLTIQNTSGFAFTTIQLTGQAAVIDGVPAAGSAGIALFVAALAIAGWVAIRRV